MAGRITAIAWLNVGLHVTGLGLAAAYIRPGSPLTPLPDRLAYLAADPVGWRVAWLVWAGCAGAMVSFTFVTARVVDSALARWAVATAAAAAAVDLACDVYYVVSLPKVAFNSGPTSEAFVGAERLSNFVSLTAANGLYSVSTLLLSLTLSGRATVLPLGIAVFAAGMVLAVAGVIDSPLLAFLATGPTIGLYCVWVLVVLRAVRERR